jgi:hypothetical protein
MFRLGEEQRQVPRTEPIALNVGDVGAVTRSVAPALEALGKLSHNQFIVMVSPAGFEPATY